MNSEERRTIVVRRSYPFSAEEVFDAWIDPEIARQWLFATPTGEQIRVEIDARVGGRFIITRRDGEDIDHVGEYLEIDRPNRLVFTFAVPRFSAEETLVTIDLVPREGGCECTLTHERILPEYADRSAEGWNLILAELDKAISRGQARKR
jgi:uncharacterized protein YndB with AHSA1/START domain